MARRVRRLVRRLRSGANPPASKIAAGKPAAPAGGGVPRWLPAGVLVAALVLGALGAGLQWLTTTDDGEAERRLAAARWLPVAPASAALPAPTPVPAATSDELRSAFTSFAFDLPAPVPEPEPLQTAAGEPLVPRLAVTRLPADLGELPDVEERKGLFIKAVLPLILLANEEVRAARQTLLGIVERRALGEAVSPEEEAWLTELARAHRVHPDSLDRLLRRLDEVPVSLALAQAIVETGWGTSRFSREGNALYGLRTWRDDLEGLVPEERPEGEDFKVRGYERPLFSVWSYLHNLNTSPAYEGFRKARALQRGEGAETLAVESLLPRLTRYAETGEDYVASLAEVIASNDLRRYDALRLAEPPAPQALPGEQIAEAR